MITNEQKLSYIQKRTNYSMMVAGNISSKQEAKEIDFIARALVVKRMVSRLTGQKY